MITRDPIPTPEVSVEQLKAYRQLGGSVLIHSTLYGNLAAIEPSFDRRTRTEVLSRRFRLLANDPPEELAEPNRRITIHQTLDPSIFDEETQRLLREEVRTDLGYSYSAVKKYSIDVQAIDDEPFQPRIYTADADGIVRVFYPIPDDLQEPMTFPVNPYDPISSLAAAEQSLAAAKNARDNLELEVKMGLNDQPATAREAMTLATQITLGQAIQA